MKKLDQFENSGIKVLFSDIDDTITTKGKLEAKAYSAIWELAKNGVQVVPITGRPAGWCEMIARFWPVAGVVGENGALYFRYLNKSKKMVRYFSIDEASRLDNAKKLKAIKDEVLIKVPGSAIASDQFTRLFDLAVDFCEDVPPLQKSDIKKITDIFIRHGATVKVSSIHVNGWFGNYNKLSACKEFCRRELKWELADHLDEVAFIGDSPNDETMFGFFKHSFAVANIQRFAKDLRNQPAYVTPSSAGDGFSELAKKLLQSRSY